MLIDQKNIRWIPALLILFNFCANLTNDIYLPSMPRLVHIFSTSANTLQLTMTMWFAGVAFPQFFFGPLTDRFGRRPILFLGSICFLVATVVCAVATNVWLFIVARFFQGVGVCSLNVTTFAILIDLFDYKKRIYILNKMNLFSTLAPLIGPVLGGYLLTYFGWRSNFIIIFFMAIISVVGLWYKLPESNAYLNPNALYIKNIFKNYYLLIKNKIFLRYLIPYCLLLGALIAYLTSAPFIIITKLKISPENFGYTQLPIFATYIAGSLFINKIDDENQIRKLSFVGIACALFATIFLFALSYYFGNVLALIIFAMILYAFGFSLCASTFVNEVMTAANFNKGSAASILGFGMAASCALCSFLIKLVYNGEIIQLAMLMLSITILATLVYCAPFSEKTFVGEESQGI